ncbi:MAG TPA: rhomboid family intramembrane serine protease [Lacipirellulaceae bacterium]
MSLLARLESKLGRYAVPNLTVALIAGQVMIYVLQRIDLPGAAPLATKIALVPDKVLQGQWWRLITYLFDPPQMNPIFAFFAWYIFYLMGVTLEGTWGTFRYNVYLAIGYFSSLAFAFLCWFATGVPGQMATNGFLYGSVFLAFARLFPDFELQLMFILPIKIKWLALLTWIWYGWTMVAADSWLTRAMVLAAVLNYLLFFGRDILQNARQGHRGMQFRARALKGQGPQYVARIVHQCRVCGLNSETAPKTQFRYCSKCGGDYCYCPEHLHNHAHSGKGSGDGGQGPGTPPATLATDPS